MAHNRGQACQLGAPFSPPRATSPRSPAQALDNNDNNNKTDNDKDETYLCRPHCTTRRRIGGGGGGGAGDAAGSRNPTGPWPWPAPRRYASVPCGAGARQRGSHDMDGGGKEPWPEYYSPHGMLERTASAGPGRWAGRQAGGRAACCGPPPHTSGTLGSRQVSVLSLFLSFSLCSPASGLGSSVRQFLSFSILSSSGLGFPAPALAQSPRPAGWLAILRTARTEVTRPAPGAIAGPCLLCRLALLSTAGGRAG